MKPIVQNRGPPHRTYYVSNVYSVILFESFRLGEIKEADCPECWWVCVVTGSPSKLVGVSLLTTNSGSTMIDRLHSYLVLTVCTLENF